MSIKIIDVCKICQNENNDFESFSVGDYSNNDYHQMVCVKRNHKYRYFHAVPDYPIFFENGLFAYHKAEYFEAFTSIYHCYEMFRLSLVQSILLEEFNISYEKQMDYLKPIRKSSVQIDGAFNTLYSAHFKSIAPDLSGKFKNLRNTIIHGSHYPVKEDVKKAIKQIYEFIYPIEQKMISSNKYPYSIFQKLGDSRLEYLQKKNVLTQQDFQNGYSSVMTDNSNILGRYPLPDTKDYTQEFSVDEIISYSEEHLKILDNAFRIYDSNKNK